MNKNLFGDDMPEIAEKPRKQRSIPKPPPRRERRENEERERPEWAYRDPSKKYFVHRQYPKCIAHPPLVFEYVAPLYYFDGREVPDFVKVRCINDLGIRCFLAGAYTAIAKRFLSPYPEGYLPDPYWKSGQPIEPKPPAPQHRITKSRINTKRR
tara:strand:+ start:35 stop:496 length:462 start_codon:yes stop_codon:yes gene_type:complete